jgi:hypothetical protein
VQASAAASVVARIVGGSFGFTNLFQPCSFRA